jgi:hypothetical protein
MRSRTFLHVSLGILALVAAYQLGARTAKAEPGIVSAGGFDHISASRALAVIGRKLYDSTEPAPTATIPGTADVMAVSRPNTGTALYSVLLADGTVWGCPSNGGWTLLATIAGSPTPARQESMGAVKARYR